MGRKLLVKIYLNMKQPSQVVTLRNNLFVIIIFCPGNHLISFQARRYEIRVYKKVVCINCISLRRSFLHFISYMVHFIYYKHSFLSREHMNPQLTCSQRQWLHSSVGRASHRYREVTGSNPLKS